MTIGFFFSMIQEMLDKDNAYLGTANATTNGCLVTRGLNFTNNLPIYDADWTNDVSFGLVCKGLYLCFSKIWGTNMGNKYK